MLAPSEKVAIVVRVKHPIECLPRNQGTARTPKNAQRAQPHTGRRARADAHSAHLFGAERGVVFAEGLPVSVHPVPCGYTGHMCAVPVGGAVKRVAVAIGHRGVRPVIVVTNKVVATSELLGGRRFRPPGWGSPWPAGRRCRWPGHQNLRACSLGRYQPQRWSPPAQSPPYYVRRPRFAYQTRHRYPYVFWGQCGRYEPPHRGRRAPE